MEESLTAVKIVNDFSLLLYYFTDCNIHPVAMAINIWASNWHWYWDERLLLNSTNVKSFLLKLAIFGDYLLCYTLRWLVTQNIMFA